MTIQLPMKFSYEALSDGLPHHAKRPSRIEPEPEPIQQQVAVGSLVGGVKLVENLTIFQ